MNCTRCGGPTKVLSTRMTAAGDQPLRRRECINKQCKTRFSTVEVVVATGRSTTIPKVGAIVATPGTRNKRARIDLVQRRPAGWLDMFDRSDP